MDELAAEVGMDPLEIREKNWITHDEFPFTTVAGLSTTPATTRPPPRKAKEIFGYDDLRAEQQRRRESGDTVQLGIGVSTYTEMCGLAPARVLGAARLRRRRLGARRASGCWPPARSRWSPGPPRTDRATRRRVSQIVADRLGVPFEDIEVLHGDTQVSPQGAGHLRVALAGRRRRGRGQAADKVIERAKPIAAHLLEATVDDIEFAAGRFSRPGHRPGVAIGEIAIAVVRGAQPARRHGADRSTRTRRSTRRTSVPARHAPLRDGGRHRDGRA